MTNKYNERRKKRLKSKENQLLIEKENINTIEEKKENINIITVPILNLKKEISCEHEKSIKSLKEETNQTETNQLINKLYIKKRNKGLNKLNEKILTFQGNTKNQCKEEIEKQINTLRITELNKLMEIKEKEIKKEGKEEKEGNKRKLINEIKTKRIINIKKEEKNIYLIKVSNAINFIKTIQIELTENKYKIFVIYLNELKTQEENKLWEVIKEIQKLIKENNGSLILFYQFIPLINLIPVFKELCTCNKCIEIIGIKNPLNIIEFSEYSIESHACQRFFRFFYLYLNSKISSLEILNYFYSHLNKENYEILNKTLSRYIYLYKTSEEKIGSYSYDKITKKIRPNVIFKTIPILKSKDQLNLEYIEDQFFSIEIEKERLLFYKKHLKKLLKGKINKKRRIPIIFKSIFNLINNNNKEKKFEEIFKTCYNKNNTLLEIEKYIKENRFFLKKFLKLINKNIELRTTSKIKNNLLIKLKKFQFLAVKPINKTKYFNNKWKQEDVICKIIREGFQLKLENYIKEKFPSEKNLINFNKIINFLNCKPSKIIISKKEFDAFFHLFNCLNTFGNIKISNPNFITPLYRNLTKIEFNEMFINFQKLLDLRFNKNILKYEEMYNSINLLYNYTTVPLIFYKVKFDYLIRNKISNLKEGSHYILNITEKETLFPGCYCCLNQNMRIYEILEIK